MTDAADTADDRSWEDLQRRLARFHERMADQVRRGERDARSLMVIPDQVAQEQVVWPVDAFGPVEDW